MANFLFHNVDHIGEFHTGEQLKFNLMEWLKWGLLNIGAFRNVSRSSLYGQNDKNLSNLIVVADPRYATNTVWQGGRQDWVWEDNLDYEHQPLTVSGVWVNNTFYSSSTTGAYAHTILYPEGRVLFATGVAATNTVQVEHSYRLVQVRNADEPWWHEFQRRSLNPDDVQLSQVAGSGGSWDVLAQNRIQLPAIVVQSVGRITKKPYEIGAVNHIHQQDFLLHVVTETDTEVERISGILADQQDHQLPTCDFNEITYPLDANGTPVSGAMTFPELCAAQPWKTFHIAKAVSSDVYDTTDKASNKLNLNKRLFCQTIRYTLAGVV